MRPEQKTILVIDDALDIAQRLQEFFSQFNYSVITAENAGEAQLQLLNHDVDVIILDLMLPDVHGFELCKQIRQNSNTPIIILSAIMGDVNRIMGLEAGADDYLEKPFNPHELLARIKAICRRNNSDSTQNAGNIFGCNGWKYDINKLELTSTDNTLVELTSIEHMIFSHLIQNPNEIISREVFANLIGADQTNPLNRTLDTHISRLRTKLRVLNNAPNIKSVRNQGYVLAETIESYA